MGAFEALYERVVPDLREYLRSVIPGADGDAGLLEEIFLTIHRARRSYDPRVAFDPWAMAVARHVASARRPSNRRTLLGAIRARFAVERW